MTPEIVLGLLIVASVLIAGVAKLMPKPRPKETHFRCARCNATAPHTERTIEAWRQKKTKFFCHACHRKWLDSQPGRPAESGTSPVGRRPAGCLSAIAFVVLLPGALIGAAAVLGWL